MRISENGLDLIKYFESCHLESYPDPGSADGNPWTIGWGHTGPEVTKGLTITQAFADELFRKDLQRFEKEVLSLVTRQPTQGEFDALVSFAYNCGSDIDKDIVVEGLGDSTLLRKYNANDPTYICEFPKWTKNDGKIMKGLIRRRAGEVALCNGKTGKEAIAHALKVAP